MTPVRHRRSEFVQFRRKRLRIDCISPDDRSDARLWDAAGWTEEGTFHNSSNGGTNLDILMLGSAIARRTMVCQDSSISSIVSRLSKSAL